MKFWIRNVPAHVAEAAHRITSACARAGLTPLDCHQVTTCAVEAINNAIVHAYREHDGYIAVRWRHCDDAIVIEVADNGIGMAGPPEARSPDPRDQQGRGWLIIREWMDEATYEQREDENVVIMLKRLPQQDASTLSAGSLQSA